MSELEYTTFLNTLSVGVADGLAENELLVLAAALTQVADTLETIAAVRAAQSAKTEN